ncbi:MAG: ISAs1 family transposase, partial [Chloroflexi bacterium]|nr:ISAs1 family transposase [Chloroflexota bacterium]
QALLERLQTLTDHRDPRGVRYPLDVLLLIAVLARLAGHSQVEPMADWARLRAGEFATLLGLKRATMPHQSTWSRVLGHAVDVAELEAVLSAFFREQQATAEVAERGSVILVIDGKAIRGTIPSGQTRGVHLLAAYLPEYGVTLAQVAVERKENEIVAAPTVLKQLNLTGVVVTGDAMHAQRALSTQIVEAGGDYCWFVKENQPEVYATLELLFARPRLAKGWSDPTTDFTTARCVEEGHGRIEERTMTVSRMLHEYVDWPYLDQVFRLERQVTSATKSFTEVRYGITSLPPSVACARRLLTIARTEWGIENGLHYRRDVTLHEDAGQVRRGHAPQVLAALNNTVIGLVLQTGARNLAAAQRAFAYTFERILARQNAV